MRNAVVVEGGCLKTPWVLHAKTINDRQFITLSKSDRRFAMAMGLDCKRRHPFSESSVIEVLGETRDKVVDEWLVNAKREADPMSDVIDDIKDAGQGRMQLFRSMDPPPFVEVQFDGFVTDDGSRIDAHAMMMVTTPRRNAAVSIEITAHNLNWLAKVFASTNFMQESPNKKRQRIELPAGLPTLQSDVCYFKKLRSGRIVLVCKYKDAEGNMRRHERTVPGDFQNNPDLFEQHALQVERDVAAHYIAHNGRSVSGDGDVDDVEDDDDDALSEHAQ